MEAAHAFEVSPSSLSRHIVEATTAQLKKSKKRALSDFTAFAVFKEGYKRVLGFWLGQQKIM